jgi:polysaccharide deacetylase 2 family uncharacterized protein YibQ
VATDELSKPLGQHKKQNKTKKRLLPVSTPQILAGVLGLFGVVVVAWASFVKDPLGGEPVAVIAAPPPENGQAARPVIARADQAAAAAVQNSAAPANGAVAPPPGSRTVTIIDGTNGKTQNVVIPGNSPGNPAAVAWIDPKMLENTRHGPIPKIAADGTRAAMLYARPRAIPANRKDAPRIAIVVGGLGISASGTADAFSKLPAFVTFALSPYATDVEKLAERARNEEHEVLLQVPMEPFDYPDNDPGPQTLLASLTPEQNVDRLQWLMSRFQGYVGALSYMGARFTSAEAALGPVLREVSRRGLIYVDDGASTRSVASQLAGSHNLPFAKTDVVLDATPTPAEIDRALARLEMTARDNGVAVGLATAQPATIARIGEWAKKVEGKGFVLVPITQVTFKAKSS